MPTAMLLLICLFAILLASTGACAFNHGHNHKPTRYEYSKELSLRQCIKVFHRHFPPSCPMDEKFYELPDGLGDTKADSYIKSILPELKHNLYIGQEVTEIFTGKESYGGNTLTGLLLDRVTSRLLDIGFDSEIICKCLYDGFSYYNHYYLQIKPGSKLMTGGF